MGVYEELFDNSEYARQDFLNFIGHANSVPDGSSPRGYSQVLVLGCRLTFAVSQLLYCRLFPMLPSLSGARPALPMGVAPEHMNKCLYLIIGSRLFFLAILEVSFFQK